MSARNETLRVIECAQALVNSQAGGAGTNCRIVSARLFEDLREAYSEWVLAKVAESRKEAREQTTHAASTM